jgi:hypothetical protein
MKNTDLYTSQNIIRVIKSRRTTYAGYVERMEKRRDKHRALVKKPEEKSPLEKHMGR